MASVKISEMTAAGALTGTEAVPILQGGLNRRTTTQDIADLGGGGGGGLALESYQNSAMSAAVMAYVYRDVSNNVFRVYEPIRNNDVSRKVFAYADSIDKVPFDNVNWFNNRIIDLKVDDFEDAEVNGCTLETMVIKVNGFTGLEMTDHKQKGLYGAELTTGNAAEIYIAGNDVEFYSNDVSGGGDHDIPDYPTYFDSVGANSKIAVNTIMGSCTFDFHGKTNLFLYNNVFLVKAGIELTENAHTFRYNYLLPFAFVTCHAAEIKNNFIGTSSNLDAGLGVTFTKIGVKCNVDTAAGSLLTCTIGDNANYSPAANKTNVRIENIAGTVYELGESGGNVTATPV